MPFSWNQPSETEMIKLEVGLISEAFHRLCFNGVSKRKPWNTGEGGKICMQMECSLFVMEEMGQ